MAEIHSPDLCVIGAGYGGIAAAISARRLGASVVLIERDRMGGTALASGAVAAKALIESARRAHAVRTAPMFGIGTDEPIVNFGSLHDHLQDVIGNLAPNDAAERLEALGIRVIRGEGRFLDKRSVGVGDVLVRARRFIIATGAVPVTPEIAGLSTVPYFTSETIYENTRRLGHLLVIGGGRMAMEQAQAFARLGVDVTLVDAAAPLADSDAELAEVVLGRLREEGVVIRSGATVASVAARPNGVAVNLRLGNDDETLSATHLLVTSVRLPNLAGLNTDRAGIRRSRPSLDTLQLTGSLKTTNHRVYAIGDAAGGPQFTHLAGYQAGLAVEAALLGELGRNLPERAPIVLDTDPAIAEVGMTEAQARKKLKERFRVVRWPFAGNHRAQARRETYGLVKLVVAPSGRILGAGIVGPEAGELISLFALAVAKRLNVADLKTYVAPYPSLSEIAQRLADEWAYDRPESGWQSWLLSVNRVLP